VLAGIIGISGSYRPHSLYCLGILTNKKLAHKPKKKSGNIKNMNDIFLKIDVFQVVHVSHA
jgi:hypothetical protein